MTPEYIPPPQYTVPPQQDVPAHYVDAPQRPDSPYEYDISHFDPDGPAPTITYSPPGETPQHEMPNQREIEEGMGPSEAQESKNQVDQDHQAELANKNVSEQEPEPKQDANSSQSNDGSYDYGGYGY